MMPLDKRTASLLRTVADPAETLALLLMRIRTRKFELQFACITNSNSWDEVNVFKGGYRELSEIENSLLNSLKSREETPDEPLEG